MPPEGNNPKRPDHQRIIEADKARFDAAKAALPHHTFPLQPDALRYIFLPPRLLELVPDPDALDVVIADHSSNGLSIFVVSKTPLPPIVDDQKRTRVLQPVHKYDNLGQHKKDILIQQGKLDANGELLLYMNLGAVQDEHLQVYNFEDRQELHELGIATSLYTRLHEVTRDLGFRFITGINPDPRSLGFFKTRGRFSLDELNPEYLHMFDYLLEDALNVAESIPSRTVDFLNPEDIPIFVKPEVLALRNRSEE